MSEYHALQKEAVALGLKATGPAAAIKRRLQDYKRRHGTNKVSPKKTPRSSPRNEELDLAQLRERYLRNELKAKTIENRLEKAWDNYFYKGKPILDEWEKALYTVKKEMKLYEKEYRELEEQRPERDVEELRAELKRRNNGRIFPQETDFVWLYSLTKDKFYVYALTEEEAARVEALKMKDPSIIELYAK